MTTARKLPILPPGTGAEIGGIIGSIIPGIGSAIGAEIGMWVQRIYNTFAKLFNKLQGYKKLMRILKGIQCIAEWFGWLSLVKSAVEFLTDLGFEDDTILELLGLGGLFSTGAKSIKKQVEDSLAQIVPILQQANEIDRRSRMTPSGLNGVHKPGYHSIAIAEIIYEFSNILGSGVMIIIFNPEGFGNKPRAPEIIRYVDEAELAEFLDADSWGNHWRVNYLLHGRKRRSRTQPIEEKDAITGEITPQPESEPLDEYIERSLDLPEFADTIIQEEFGELITQAFDRQEFLTSEFTKVIENGKLGRGVEREGLRVTSAIQDKFQAIPNNVKRWTATNPIFKDVVGVTNQWKRQLTKMRAVRDRFVSAASIGSLKAESLALSGTLGVLGKSQVAVAVASDFGLKIGKGGAVQATKTGSVATREFISSTKNYKLVRDDFLKQSLSAEAFSGGAELDKEFLNVIQKADKDLFTNLILGEEVPMSSIINVIKKASSKEKLIILKNLFTKLPGELAGAFVKPPTCIPFLEK